MVSESICLAILQIMRGRMLMCTTAIDPDAPHGEPAVNQPMTMQLLISMSIGRYLPDMTSLTSTPRYGGWNSASTWADQARPFAGLSGTCSRTNDDRRRMPRPSRMTTRFSSAKIRIHTPSVPLLLSTLTKPPPTTADEGLCHGQRGPVDAGCVGQAQIVDRRDVRRGPA